MSQGPVDRLGLRSSASWRLASRLGWSPLSRWRRRNTSVLPYFTQFARGTTPGTPRSARTPRAVGVPSRRPEPALAPGRSWQRADLAEDRALDTLAHQLGKTVHAPETVAAVHV